jgi:radical SAM/Cys-rich protein
MRMPSALQNIPSFTSKLAEHRLELTRQTPRVLQVNVGKLCNLTCVHCHVNAGPGRQEIMTRETVDHILRWLKDTDIEVVDLTGGTPEMIPDFRYMVECIRGMGKTVMDRCNLTILNELGYEWVADFHAEHGVEVVASMPCYCPKNVNEQRGNGVFDSSIKALQTLNALGYGREAHLKLDLVYNPNGASLPPEQSELEADYKRELKAHFGIVFNQLYAITNMPIARFTSYLKREGVYADYMQLLLDNFNPGSVAGLMCRDTINVDWEGRVYDCDFNQQLGLMHEEKSTPLKVWELDFVDWLNLPILTGSHCYGCTAGQGSSCGGATA